MRTQNAADQRGIDRRRRTLAADIADDNRHAVERVIHEVVQIAADGSRRRKLARRLPDSSTCGKRLRQQAELQFARQCQVALQAPLLAGNLLV